MQSDLAKLLELQRIDTEVARLKQEISALPKRVVEIETKLAGNLAAVEKAKAAAKENDQKRRKYEGEIQTLQQKISKYRDQMLAVKTNDEYRALGNEIKFAEDAIRGYEDKILECMVQSEDLDTNIKAAEKSLTIEKAAVEKEKNEARSRTAEHEKALSELLPSRSELRTSIGDQILRHYDRVLKQRGSAVSEVRDQICQACHVMLRPQVFQEVLAGKSVLTCDSCGRILYYDPPRDVEAENAPYLNPKLPDVPPREAASEASPDAENMSQAAAADDAAH
ncbi:MAG TPA: C4-type zinc ribbon domain-containing protein [Terriglobales bacterium]|nr:C4-type zinc ribbon domain-containing protein [Terriglobales bacterium]